LYLDLKGALTKNSFLFKDSKLLSAKVHKTVDLRSMQSSPDQRTGKISLERGQVIGIEALHLHESGRNHITISLLYPSGELASPLPSSALTSIDDSSLSALMLPATTNLKVISHAYTLQIDN
jgi:hypothetical protein